MSDRTHDDPWIYEQAEQMHTSGCDEGPNHPGPCHPTKARTMSERTVYPATPSGKIGVLPEERQVSVPWCVVHDSTQNHDGLHCDETRLRIAWQGGGPIDGPHCDIREGVVWKVVSDE